jgi:hypothetical protein
MTPIFFPFTYMPPASAEALRSCFTRMTVLQPGAGCLPADMAPLAASGWLDVRLPVGGDDTRLEAVMKDYRDWAEVHRGVDAGVLRSLGDRPPFYQDNATSRIRDAIRGQEKSSPEVQEVAAIFPDLIFLGMAQEFDVQNQLVREDLKNVMQMEARLFGLLKGEQSKRRQSFGDGDVRTTAPGEYMLEERLASWSRLLALSVGGDSVPLAAVTTSLTAIEYLLEHAPDLKKVGRIEPIAAADPAQESMEKGSRNLSAILQTLATAEAADALSMPAAPVSACSGGTAAWVVLYVCPGIGLVDFLAAAVGSDAPEPPRTEAVNTVIGLVRPAGATDPV